MLLFRTIKLTLNKITFSSTIFKYSHVRKYILMINIHSKPSTFLTISNINNNIFYKNKHTETTSQQNDSQFVRSFPIEHLTSKVTRKMTLTGIRSIQYQFLRGSPTSLRLNPSQKYRTTFYNSQRRFLSRRTA